MNVRGVNLGDAINVDLLWGGAQGERMAIPYNYICTQLGSAAFEHVV
jgi:hypothetical protein